MVSGGFDDQKNASLRGSMTKQSAFLTSPDCFVVVPPSRNDGDVGLVRHLSTVISVILSLTLFCCTPPSTQQSATSTKITVTPDSIFEYFENIADTLPEKYVLNPDSFLNTLQLHPQSLDQQEMYAYGLIFMAYGLREYGDHYNSIRYYEKALNFTQEQQLKDIDTHLYIIKPLAALYTLIDDNQKAISLLEQILHEIPKDHYAERVGFANNLANAYLYNRDISKAKKLLLETLDRPANTLMEALLCNTLSAVYKDDNDMSNSIRFNERALEGFAKNSLDGDTLVWYSSALGLYGEIHNDYAAAQRALHILDVNFPNTQHRTKANIQLIKANILWRKHSIESAQDNYRQAIETLFTKVGDEYTLDYTYTQALVGMARCHSIQNQIDSALYYYQWAIENDFRTQQLITSKKNQINNNIWNRGIIEDMFALAEKLLRQNSPDQDLLQTLLWCIELSKGRLLINEINRSENWDKADPKVKTAIRTIRNLYQKINQSTNAAQRQSLQKQIDQLMIDFQLSERYFETYNYSPDKTSFLKKLNDHTKNYYSYFVHQDSTVTVIGRLNNTYVYHKVSDPTFMRELRQFKASYFGNTPNEYNRDPQRYAEQSTYIVHELLPHIDRTQRDICLSLDGQLYGLPFDALYEKDFLVNSYNFAYLNSFILYDLLDAPPMDKTDISLLYRSTFPKPLPDLNFVQDEINNIGKKFNSQKIGPEQQQDSTIVQQFGSAHIIHIAAHTILDPQENPIIYLQHPISTEQLRFYHIYSPMVFLSACNTGSGKSLPSEGMESIQRVFLGKGVPSVISTYWFANDEAMLQLTSLFYEELYTSKNPVEALAGAKRIFLSQASIEHQNPWYWANINYAGIGNEVGLRKNTNLPVYMMIGVLLVLIALGLGINYLRSGSTVKKNKKSKNQID